MLLALPRLLFVRLAAAVLLLTVGVQAGAPLMAPLERSHGSAFSAATHEVALAAQRRAEPARLALAPQPRLPLPEAYRAPRLEPLPVLRAARPDSTGPPARTLIARRPAPRAPPFA